ncbi:cytochrome c oxidase assembly factor CtaG [Halobacillus kuroshimensis]|uniref:Cytochrome c oxidase assembly factor CtaG n=1 Tax=Halobacillus kuroshimensis TaxID=302481 RepID=A0ABS3DSJ4_9BACI|nr:MULTISPECIES: cytochrome c oxidase assembly factor CtaG [Halobacillus]MBN8234318.1 cytochrome c oxidase assembly factor CtaG [Halobacillus kuroshimensis]
MWLELQIFGFRALWSPLYFLFVLGLALVYFYITGPGRKKGEERPNTARQFMFYTGLVLLYIVKGSPVDLLGHIMFTAHMTQMALYYLLFPILIIRGIPAWIWEWLFKQNVVRPVMKLLTKPLLSLILFNGLFSLYHMPVIFDYAKSSETAHAVITTVILITAFCMWISIFPPLESMDALSPIMKIGFIFANGVLITPACGLIIFAGSPLYATYSEAGAWLQAMSLCVPVNVLSDLSASLSGPAYFTPMPLIEDQQLGGIIMKVTQEIIFGSVIAYIFFSWFNRERDTIDPLPGELSSET